jgi:hypothetical protein
MNEAVDGSSRGHVRCGRAHQPADGDILKDIVDHHLVMAHDGSIVEEPADKGQPDSADNAAAEQRDTDAEGHHDASGYEEPGDRLPQMGSPDSGPAQVMGHSPQKRAHDPSAVQRKSRNEIEQADDDVDLTEPAQQSGKRADAVEPVLDIVAQTLHVVGVENSNNREDQAENNARERADDRHNEFGRR